MLSEAERRRLREIAREAIHATLSGETASSPLPGDGPLSRPGSCFVTIRRGSRLRGCIGLVGDPYPLAETVRQAAIRSLSDPRFPPLSASDLPDLEFEVSVLGPFRPVGELEEVEPGRDGVKIRLGARSALFLPQVAAEQGWGRERLLTELCRKAGIESDGWRDPRAEILVFEAEVF